MAWGIIRKVTKEDHDRLEAAAKRFMKRHPEVQPFEKAAFKNVEFWVGYESLQKNDKTLQRLWLQCKRRALREPGADGIAWGYVGYHVA